MEPALLGEDLVGCQCSRKRFAVPTVTTAPDMDADGSLRWTWTRWLRRQSDLLLLRVPVASAAGWPAGERQPAAAAWGCHGHRPQQAVSIWTVQKTGWDAPEIQ